MINDFFPNRIANSRAQQQSGSRQSVQFMSQYNSKLFLSRKCRSVACTKIWIKQRTQLKGPSGCLTGGCFIAEADAKMVKPCSYSFPHKLPQFPPYSVHINQLCVLWSVVFYEDTTNSHSISLSMSDVPRNISGSKLIT